MVATHRKCGDFDSRVGNAESAIISHIAGTVIFLQASKAGFPLPELENKRHCWLARSHELSAKSLQKHHRPSLQRPLYRTPLDSKSSLAL
jgi:hypothetical protein